MEEARGTELSLSKTFISQLAERRVCLSVEGDKLKYSAPEGAIDDHMKLMLRKYKDGLIKTLQQWSGYQLVCPLSYNQQALFFLYLFEPSSSAYNLALSMRFKSAVDAEKLKMAMEMLAKRHEQLRTTFGHIELGENLLPVQFIHEELFPSFEVIEAHNWPEAVLTEKLQAFYQRPFDLEKGPVVRAGLFVRSKSEAIFVLALHHIVSDGWSMNLILRDLAAAYCGELNINEKKVRGMEYTDFVLAQHRILGTASGREHLDYWLKVHKPPVPVLDWNNNTPRPRKRRSVGATHYFHLDSSVRDSLEGMAREQGITIFVLMLSVFEWLLFERSGRRDVAVGIPVVGHNERRFENTVGYFVNSVPLRSERVGNLSFLEHAQATAQELLMALDHRYAPFAAVVEQLGGARDISRTPVFQVMFHFLSRKMLGNIIDLIYPFDDSPPVDFGGLVATACPLDQQNGQFDLTLELIDSGRNYLGLLRYSTDLFTTADAEDLASAFCAKLKVVLENPKTAMFSSGKDKTFSTGTMRGNMDPEADGYTSTAHSFRNQQYIKDIASNPDQRLSEKITLSNEERHQLLVEWNDTQADYPADACIHELFEEIARRNPDAVAIEFEGRQLTYADLDTRSSQFSEHLQTLGVGPDTLVALYLDRSLEMVVALIGILRAGGAYLPLDRMFPRERLAFMVEDAIPRVMVTLTKLLDEIPSHRATVVCVDDYPQAAEAPAPQDRSTSDNLAYVLYTSGSTGKPKGVEITHGALVNFLTSMRKKPGIDERDVLLSVTTISFDILGLELWLPLITGAKVVIVGQEITMNGQRLAAVMAESNVTVMQATPSTWRILLESGWEGNSHLKILCGGESWSQELAESLLTRCASLWNMYGPTETTIWSAVCQIVKDGPMSLGRPIANTRFYVVNEQLEVLPVGAPGELLIGGVGLARGYLNQPELTAEKFIPDPFSENANSRLYRTGDTVRYLPDGRLAFVGRLDQQIKIRGFRIELGEIESLLNAKSGIKQAVVVIHEGAGEKYLSAYIVQSDEVEQSASDLRAYLKQKLPAYMIPAKFVFLSEFPLTLNGKVDRKALSVPNGELHTEVNSLSPGRIDPRIVEWNKTDIDYPLDKCLHSFIEEQVVRSPNAPALTYEDNTLSYEELNRRVNRLSHFLQSRGVGPEVFVGVCTFRSMEMVIALLAIVKAGGAYVPFDPSYPVNRLEFMINDSKVPFIIAQKKCSSVLKPELCEIIYFEDINEILESFPATNPTSHTNPNNLAYIIYTSGSTGNPKGVMNTHKGIVNRLLWMQDTFHIGPGDTLLQKTTFSFDVSVWEFFWPFMCGARLVVAEPEGHKDVDYLLNLISKEKITIIHFVPSMLRLFLERATQELCASFKHVVLSGESLTIDLQKRYFNVLKAPLHNLYGPTEAAVDVSYWKCDPLSKSDVVPIGRPISNTKLYVLDDSLQSIQIGESGELHIGGVQVARGYLNRPELTAEKFIQDPFSENPSARLYKTGDRCRFLPDGNIEYIGRIDFQVKISGNRVELGEIETEILKDSSIKDCAVLFREDKPGEPCLVAYVVENQGRFLLSAMRSKLSAKLPYYMIPTVFVRMPLFPLTPSGKIDRLALPMPDRERPELATIYVAPRSEIERLVVKTWQDLLPFDTIGLDDNFFDVGGHSLLLIRMANILKNLFHKEISVMSLFEHPTIREQVDFIRGIESEDKPTGFDSSETSVTETDWEDGAI